MSVVGIGLANIDLMAHVEETFLSEHGIKKGLAQKVDDLVFGRIRAALDFHAIPGGCAANTICGLSAVGVPSRFYGKIGADSFESLYRASFQDYMVAFDVVAGAQESSQCAVLVTPDGERSFAYTHGAAWDLKPEDLSAESIARASMIYAEVYLFEFGSNKDTARFVFENAAASNVPVVMKVMDDDFGRRYAQKIRELARAGVVSLLIGNHENLPFVVGERRLEAALEAFKEWSPSSEVLLTANRDGAYFISGGMVQHFPVEVLEKPKNTTGAGDQFVAGFLAAKLEGKPVGECMARAAAHARMILAHDMARPPLVTNSAIRF